MTKIRVYRFRMWDQSRGDYRESQKLATREAIDASQNLEMIPDGALEVDASLLDGNGMTRTLGASGRWAYGAVDDQGSAYVVIESLREDPRLSREAYPLQPNSTLKHAEDIAAEFNRYGSYIFRGGRPLVGDQIPQLHRVED